MSFDKFLSGEEAKTQAHKHRLAREHAMCMAFAREVALLIKQETKKFGEIRVRAPGDPIDGKVYDVPSVVVYFQQFQVGFFGGKKFFGKERFYYLSVKYEGDECVVVHKEPDWEDYSTGERMPGDVDLKTSNTAEVLQFIAQRYSWWRSSPSR